MALPTVGVGKHTARFGGCSVLFDEQAPEIMGNFPTFSILSYLSEPSFELFFELCDAVSLL